MTQLRILELAYDSALMKWGRYNEELQQMPDNRIRQSRERKAYKELEEVRELLLLEEKKAKAS